MSRIVSAQIMGIRQAQNTIGDTTFNSTNYSVLVFYDNGTTNIFEGDANQIAWLMPYVPRQDSNESLKKLLAEHELKIRRIMDEEIYKVFEALHPIPAVDGMKEADAIATLQAKDLKINLVNTYPDGIPEGKVFSCTRCMDAPMTVDLDIRHELPDVMSMSQPDALNVLRSAGFTPKVEFDYDPGYTEVRVINVERGNECTLDVSVTFSSPAPNVIGQSGEKAIDTLRAAGFTCSIKQVINEQVPNGDVIDVEYMSDMGAILTISRGSNVRYANKVTMTWNNLPDSLMDEYPSVSAWIDRKAYNITLQFELISQCKKPHTLTGNGRIGTGAATVRPLKTSYEIKSNDSIIYTV